MLKLAVRQLMYEPLRTILTVTAIGFVVSTMLVLSGFEQGLYYQLRRVVLDRGADLIVTQAGVSSFLTARSSLPQLSREEVERIDGVREAYPMTGLTAIYEKEGIKTFIYIFVFDKLGGPISMIEGSGAPEGREVIIDLSLAKKYGIKVGDPLTISDFTFTISAISRDSAAFFMPLVFITYDGMIDLFLESEMAPDISAFPLLSYLLVDLDPGADPARVSAEIESEVDSADVFFPERLADNGAKLGREMLGPIMGLLVFISFIVGLLVVSLIMSAEVNARLRSFGVLKALGFRNRSLVKTLIYQSLLLLLISLPIGVFAAYLLAEFIHSAEPLYIVQIFDKRVFVQTIVGSVLFASLGGLTPLRVLRRTDPQEVFQRG